jgi:hypothetical protein
MIPLTAAKLGVTYQTIAARIKSQPQLAERYAQIRELDRCKRAKRAERTIDSLLEENHFGAAELTLSRLGKDRGWAPDKQGNGNLAVHFEVVHIIPEAAEPGYLTMLGESDAATNQLTTGESDEEPDGTK